MGENQELVQALTELEAILAKAEHNGVNLIIGMGGQRMCHVCEKYQAVVQEALKTLRAQLSAGTRDNTPGIQEGA